MLFLRKSVWPLREAISKMQRTDSHLVSESTKIYLRDVYDHTIQVIENIETFRDMSASLLETYLSSLSNRLNEVIKLLTIISTIFIPLTFLAGLYGMNFRFMPELESPWGYPAVLIFMLLVVVTMLTYFHRKKWIWASIRAERLSKKGEQKDCSVGFTPFKGSIIHFFLLIIFENQREMLKGKLFSILFFISRCVFSVSFDRPLIRTTH